MFINLKRGNKQATWLGYTGVEPKFGRDSTFLEIPASGFLLDGELILEGKRNQTLELKTEATIQPKTGKAILVWNPELASRMTAPSTQIVERDDGEYPVKAWVTLRKDTKVEDLSWVCRIYLHQEA